MYALEYFDIRDEKWHECQLFATLQEAEEGFGAARRALIEKDPAVRWWKKIRLIQLLQGYDRPE